MRIFCMLALFAAGFMASTPAMAQVWETWQYEEEVDPFTDKITKIHSTARIRGKGSIDVTCRDEYGLEVGARFYVADVHKWSIPIAPAHIKWRINKGNIIEFTLKVAFDTSYVIRPPLSIGLARMLVNAKQFITSNGADEVLQFEKLTGGKNVARVLKACGR